MGYTEEDLSQFEDAPEDSNQDSACSLSNNNGTPENQLNQLEEQDFVVDDDDDYSDEEEFDSDFGENDDGVPESKGPNRQVYFRCLLIISIYILKISQ